MLHEWNDPTISTFSSVALHIYIFNHSFIPVVAKEHVSKVSSETDIHHEGNHFIVTTVVLSRASIVGQYKCSSPRCGFPRSDCRVLFNHSTSGKRSAFVRQNPGLWADLGNSPIIGLMHLLSSCS